MNETSLSLLDRIRETSDSEPWNRLIALYTPLLKSWVRRYEVQDSDADDIVQEVLTVVLKDLPEFRHNQRTGAFRSWLRTILVNRVREFWRARKYRPLATGSSSLETRLNELQDHASELSRIWNREHDRFVLNRIMKAIEPQFESKTWLAFRRQVVGGEASESVAHELEMSISAVYMAKSRVLAALRRESEGLVDLF